MIQSDKNKAARQNTEKVSRDAQQAAKEAERNAKEKQRDNNNRIEEGISINKSGPKTYSDQVNGYLENFHKDFLSATRDANLGPQATSWLMNNQDLVLNQHIGGGRKGGVLSGASLANIYESQRGMARKQGQTNATEIQAQTIG